MQRRKVRQKIDQLVFPLVAILLFTGFTFAQTKRVSVPHPTPAKTTAKTTAAGGIVVGRTYTNKNFGFEVTFPDTWLIPDSDFEAYMKKQGFDLSLKAPDSLPPASQTKINDAVRRVEVL